MKQKKLIVMAIASTFALSASVFAGGTNHQRGADVRTPANVSESGSSLESIGVGASSSRRGSGSVGYETTAGTTAEYWHMDRDSSVGSSSGRGASSSGGFGGSGISRSPTNAGPVSD